MKKVGVWEFEVMRLNHEVTSLELAIEEASKHGEPVKTVDRRGTKHEFSQDAAKYFLQMKKDHIAELGGRIDSRKSRYLAWFAIGISVLSLVVSLA